MSFDLYWHNAPQPVPDTRAPDTGTPDDDSVFGQQRDDDEDSEPEYYNPQTGETSNGAAGMTKRPLRVPGGIAAIAKRIVADYDSDDARIIELKQQGYADEYVANKLKEEDRIRYVAKTVGSRWLRLRKVLEDRDDQRLDDEMSDWHIGEDEMVANIKNDVDKKFAIQFQRLEDKMWKEVSIYLADKMGRKKYTAKACEERFEQIKAGTALLPIELDDDQAGRRRMREQRIANAKAVRAAREQAVKDAELDKKARAEARKQAKAEAAVQKRQFMEKRAAEKMERERIKQEREEFRQQAKHDRLYRLALLRAEREWQLERWRQEKVLYKEWAVKMGIARTFIGGQSDGNRNTKDGYDTASEEELEDQLDSSEEEVLSSDEDGLADDESDEDRRDSMTGNRGISAQKTPSRRVNPARNAKSSSAKASERKGKVIDYDDDDEDHAEFEVPDQVEQVMNKAQVTEESLRSARSIMSLQELDMLISQRGLERRQRNESHPEVVARIMHADTKLNKGELDKLLHFHSEQIRGPKSDKIERLQIAEASQSENGRLGIKSDDVEFMRGYEPYQGEWAYMLQEREDMM